MKIKAEQSRGFATRKWDAGAVLGALWLAALSCLPVAGQNTPEPVSGAQAHQTVASVTTSDGKVFADVKALRVEGDKVLLSYSGGAEWVALNSLSDEARKSLGLRTREEQALFEMALGAMVPDWREVNANRLFLAWLAEKNAEDPVSRAALMRKALQESDFRRVAEIMNAWKAAQGAAEQERLARKEREDRWRDAAMRDLDRPSHRVSFVGPDGTTVTKESSALTPEESALYVRHYIEVHEAIWRETAKEPARGEEHAQAEAAKNSTQDEASQRLAGPNHEVSFTGPDGTTIKKDSSALTPEERALYIKQYAAAKEASEEHWREMAVRNLDGPNHRVSFAGPDGTNVTKDSSLLTPEERTLYINHYVELRVAAEERRRWMEEARKTLDGPNHEVSFTGPDGKRITKDSSLLTPAEKAAYIRQYLEENAPYAQEAVARRNARLNYLRDEAANRLAGQNHAVSFIGPDGKRITKDSSLLTPAERTRYISQYAEEHAAAGNTPATAAPATPAPATPAQHSK
ncbi:MAG: hypothetical protein ABSA67_17430 [Candidatus Brocadiia bacterium]|jgi:hypothetical protein